MASTTKAAAAARKGGRSGSADSDSASADDASSDDVTIDDPTAGKAIAKRDRHQSG